MVKAITTLAELDREFAAAGEKVVLVDFFATWCGPCKMIAPKLEEVSKNNAKIVVLKVDVDQADAISQKYEISAMPTFIFFKHGQPIETLVGANEEKLLNLVKKYTA